jgi:hypothetical protein
MMKYVWPLVGIAIGISVGALWATAAALQFDLSKGTVSILIGGVIGFFGGVLIAMIRPKPGR